jgi:tetratricopeptide (TPR) repeat protein
MRAKGFALLVAVVRNPAQRQQLIQLLGEAMLGTKLQTVVLGSQSTDILEEIQKQLGSEPAGPVMVVGFEDAVPSDAANHPILNALNLRRPDWPQRVPQPVVFWVPEFLLGILARSAPDFMDWRSDTIHFPEVEPAQFEILKSATWGGGADTRMSAAARMERVRELRSRITSNEHQQDPAICLTVAGWLNELGLHLMLLGQNQEALDQFQRALSIVRDLGDKRGQGVALGNLGAAYGNLGDIRKAVEFHERALAMAREIGDKLGEAQDLGNLANACQQLGNTTKAIEFYEASLFLHRKLCDRRGEGMTLGNLGLVYADLGEPRKALDFHERQLVIVREIGDRRGEGSALQNLGNAYADLGDKRKATEFHEQALAKFRELGDRRGESGALGDLGTVFAELGDTRKALACYEQALAIAREIGDRRIEGYALGNIAVAYNQLGRRVEAIAHFELALKVFDALEEPYAAKVRAALAELRK